MKWLNKLIWGFKVLRSFKGALPGYVIQKDKHFELIGTSVINQNAELNIYTIYFIPEEGVAKFAAGQITKEAGKIGHSPEDTKGDEENTFSHKLALLFIME